MPWRAAAPCAPNAVADHAALLDALRRILGPGFGVGACDPRTASDPLWDAERPAMARAVPKRVLEFAAGRTAARAAMTDIGLKPAAIPMGADRAPIWPDGMIGSIAHCNSVAIAALAPAGTAGSIGIDIEENTPLPRDLWDTICTPRELGWLATQPDDQHATLAKHIFTAKEAIYKAQYPLTGQMIGFEDVDITLTETGFTARLADRRATGTTTVLRGLIIAQLCFTDIGG